MAWHEFARFSERLDARQIAVETAAAQGLAPETAGCSHQLVNQHHTGRRFSRSALSTSLPARCRWCRCLHEGEASSRRVARRVRPERADALRAVLPRVTGGVGVPSAQHAGLRHVLRPGLVIKADAS